MMAKVHYLDGDTTQYGYDFTGGKPVEVTDERHLAKFRGNPFFGVQDDKAGKAPKEAPAGYVTKHKGGGKFIVMFDGKEVAAGLTKADAEAFDAMSDEDKAEYVKVQ